MRWSGMASEGALFPRGGRAVVGWGSLGQNLRFATDGHMIQSGSKAEVIRLAIDEHSKEQADELLKNSLLYREFLAEREEILRHKWIESEKAGRDVGFERALLDWTKRHRADWRASRQKRLAEQHAK